MKASELRIANLILFEGKIIEVNYINKFSIGWGKTNFAPNTFESFKPIPLTEDWLIKLGFIKNNQSFIKDCFILQNTDMNSEHDYWVVGFVDAIKSITPISDKIEYVHQLQNLYFALTQTELIIK